VTTGARNSWKVNYITYEVLFIFSKKLKYSDYFLSSASFGDAQFYRNFAFELNINTLKCF